LCKNINYSERVKWNVGFFTAKLPTMPFITTHGATAGAVARQLLQIEAIRINHQKPFTWSSGWKSPVYCDNRLALSYPDIRRSIKEALVGCVRHYFPEAACIAGVATAGVPQGALVADALHLPYVYVRPKPKEHGMGNLIEGKITRGQRVVLVEDLVSTGGSSLKAAEALRDAGFSVVGMVAIFTYGFPEAERAFAAARVPLVVLSDFDTLLEEAVAMQYVSADDLIYIKSWRLDPAHWS
jgi:orotate phosphoribosyltransferase